MQNEQGKDVSFNQNIKKTQKTLYRYLLFMGITCRYSFSIPADKQWGVVDENGTWDGTAGDIQRKVNCTAPYLFF